MVMWSGEQMQPAVRGNPWPEGWSCTLNFQGFSTSRHFPEDMLLYDKL